MALDDVIAAAERAEEALRQIKKRVEAAAPHEYKQSTIWQIADAALKEEK